MASQILRFGNFKLYKIRSGFYKTVFGNITIRRVNCTWRIPSELMWTALLANRNGTESELGPYFTTLPDTVKWIKTNGYYRG